MDYPIINYHAPFNVNLLQFDISGHSNVLPLWSSKNLRLREEEYFNFEIRDGSSDCISDDSVKEIETNIPKSMCHICNIEVPSGYMRLHQSSDKHKIYVKISEIALERVRRQMGESYTTENINPSMYFCQSCVVLVHVTDKQLHLDSNIHKNSICIDKMLIDFSKLYSDEEIDRKFENIAIVSKETTQYTKESVNFETAILENEKQTANKPKDNSLIINPNKSSLDENYKHIIDNLTTEVFKCKIKYFNQQQLIIVTEDNMKLKVNHDNFHSFSALGSKHVQCKLCGEITKNIREHMYENGHLMKLALPIDKNCIRKINSKAHCILCNELVDNPEIHSLCNKVHDRMMMSAIYEQDETNFTESELKKEIPNYYFCKVCYIPVHKNDTNIHFKDSKHICNTKTEAYYLLEYSNSLRKLKCNVCFIYFPMNMAEEHLSNSSHLSMYENLLASNYLIKSTNNIFCELCILHLEIGNEINHIKTSEHLVLLKTKNFIPKESKSKKNKKLPKETKDEQKNDVKQNSIDSNVGTDIENTQRKSNENLVTCKVCDITMQDTDKDIKHHLLVNHQIEHIKTVIENSTMKSVGSSLICESCCEYVAITDKIKHLSNPTHIVKSFKKQKNDKKSQLPNPIIKKDDKNNNELNTKTKDIFFVPKKEKIDTKKPIHCSICNSTVPNGFNSMQIHENGKKHNTNLQAILSKNNIEVRSDHLRCTVCCMDIEKDELIPHINSDYHTCVEEKSKKSITDISYCELCNKYITTNMDRHVLSVAHKSKEIHKNVANFLCFVCDVLLTNSELNIREHNEGAQHKNNIKILNDNTVKVSDDKCYCETCDVKFTHKMIKPHINSSQHLILMGNDMQQ